MESAHQFSFRPDCNKTQKCLLFCALLFQQSHSFRICVVSSCNDSKKDLHKLFRILRNCQCKWLLASSSAPRTFVSIFVFSCEKFCFARIRLDPLGGQVLHHDCISMIVFGFTEKILICCNQITKIVCTKSPPLRLLHGALVILVLWQIRQFRSLRKWV